MRVTEIGTRLIHRGIRTLGAFLGPRGPVVVIKRQEIPYWQECGWVRQGGLYWGNYQTRYGSFQGLIEDRGQGDLRFYMIDPPPQVRSCSHWQCFQPRGRKGFLVHMATRPWDVSSGIMTIERFITDAYEGRT
jgi:hypothetical protein